jgi:hypothetical protein
MNKLTSKIKGGIIHLSTRFAEDEKDENLSFGDLDLHSNDEEPNP